MLEAIDEVEHEILWEMNRGSTNVWHENWTGIGALYRVVSLPPPPPPEFNINEELQDVVDLRTENGWDDQLLDQTFPEDILEHISKEVYFDHSDEYWDTPKWMPTTSGKFTVGSAWQILRHRDPTNPEYKLLWTKGLPLKISFFIWKLWRGKVPTDDLWRRNGHLTVSKFWCCLPPQEETLQHIFLASPTASRVWKVFLQAAGVMVNLVQIHQVIRAWWSANCCAKLRPLFQVAPTFNFWELWKKRNTMKDGVGVVSFNRLVHKLNKTLYYLARVRYPWLPNIPLIWPDMVRYFEGYKPYVITKGVTWQLPYKRWFKCNTDGASRGNPGPGSYDFCVRDNAGDVVFVRAEEIGLSTNIVAEAKAIVEGLSYYIQMQLHPLIIETDSLVLKKFIEGEWEVPWSIEK
uniref:RNase H type-1 domain-containing protein n=1 Tax=Nicotiana tabacum TaxID=4097 RepID=A0A1S4AT76_TOBAC|nr:PREDICTED: uncharacterized protein LOC107801042 [Nicotiana tabacum]